MRFTHPYLLGSLLLWLSGATELSGDEPVDYVQQIKPILAERCFGCHGALRQRSGLRLDAVQLLRAGGDQGAAVVPGKGSESLLVQAIRGDGDVLLMPPEDEGRPLDDKEIALITAWIDQGAKAEDEEVPPDPRLHWAYQLPQRTNPPQSKTSPAAHPIDAFLDAERQRRGVVPRPEASRETLLRRVYFDLVGLTPTRDELHAFRADATDQAYETVVDRLLASPRYGERWGRHWMDVWRYSDWFGLVNKMRHSQKHIWRWRDWIVESINEDKGYDRMIVEMLAGDEIAPGDAKTVRATGFLARNWYLYNRNYWLDDVVEHTAKGFLGITMNCVRCHEHKYDPIAHEDYYRFRAFFEPHRVRLDHVGSEMDLEKDGMPRVYDADLEAETYLFVRGEETRPDKTRAHKPGVPAVVGTIGPIVAHQLPVAAYYPELRGVTRRGAIAAAEAAIEKAIEEVAAQRAAVEIASAEVEELVAAASKEGGDGAKATGAPQTVNAATAGDNRSDAPKSKAESQASLAAAQRALAAAEKKTELAKAETASLKARIASDVAKFLGDDAPATAKLSDLATQASVLERQAKSVKAELELLLAEHALESARSTPAPRESSTTQAAAIAAAEKRLTEAREAMQTAQAAAEAPGVEYSPAGNVYPTQTTGRRTALAHWIANPKNPLTARVAVNHVWTRHFGAPLVSSMFDFGLRTPRPPHHELLDWLAVEFMESGWSTKTLHRLIMTSQAYQMQSRTSGSEDPNLSLDPDNRLFWRMNPRRMEAESVRDTLIYLAGELDTTMGGADLPIAAGDEGTRRTIYYRYTREDQIKFLTMFDAPNVEECYRRRDSVVPQQALAMSNSKMVLARARKLAAEITREVVGADTPAATAAFIASAFERIIGRLPTADEHADCRTALRQFETAANADTATSDAALQRARENLVHVLLNHNDFITIR